MVVKNPRKLEPEDSVSEPKLVTEKVATVVQPEPVSSKTEYYCLLINDSIQKLGKSLVPQGDWYYCLLDLAGNDRFGPFPLLVYTRGHLETVRGFVQLDVLSSLVYSDMIRLGLKGLRDEPSTPIRELNSTKMMSCIISIEWLDKVATKK